MSLRQLVAVKAAHAMAAAGIPADYAPHVNYSSKPEFGDLQINGVMGAAKGLKVNPRDLAQNIVDQLDAESMCTRVEIAGPGFINLHLKNDWLADYVEQHLGSTQLGVPVTQSPETVVVDYSGPNLAKEMHVGHLRATVIGDAVVRVLECLGHRVIRQNHVGDWGTQFGMLIAELEEQSLSGDDAQFQLADLESFYRQSKAHFDTDESFADKAREYVVRLQSGDAACLALWQKFIDISLSHSEAIYQKLGATLERSHVRGESSYNQDLSVVVSELAQKGLCSEDQGAQVAFLEELADKKGNPSPVIVKKADGGYLYSTSDLAALRYRVSELNADRILYFIDERQSLHLKQVFTLARKAGWVPQSVELLHCAFGTMMGADGKPFKTRSGDTVKLNELLDEAVARADNLLAEKNPDLSAADRKPIASAVGIGAVKYADLRMTRTNDYLFEWESMLSFEGNTAPYLQYAYARIQSIFRKSGADLDDISKAILIKEPAERDLALSLAQFGEVVEQVGIKGYPHELCTYLFELSGQFMSFYESCPILRESVPTNLRDSRLQLSMLTARVLNKGLALLGVQTLDRM